MDLARVKTWAKETAQEGHLLSTGELEVVLMKAGEQLLREAAYERVGDRGVVYKRPPTRNAADGSNKKGEAKWALHQD